MVARAAAVLSRYQMVSVTVAEAATRKMLEEQHIASAPEARLNPIGFTTPVDTFTAITESIDADWQFQRIVESIMQDTARAAQQASIAVESKSLGWVRHLTLPSCSRCAVLAGRVYRWSDGFQRHPNCDCTMTPCKEGDDRLVHDPVELAREGKVTGLSRDDKQALADSADFGQIVNVRLKKAGLTVSGVALSRAGRLTPAGIYQQAAGDRSRAVELLQKYGYIL